jgi:hypothetical protein
MFPSSQKIMVTPTLLGPLERASSIVSYYLLLTEPYLTCLYVLLLLTEVVQ